MKHRNGVFGLLGAAAISTFALPVFANTASEQIGTQSATINGDNNQVIQVINQVNISHPGLGRGLGNNDRRVQGGTAATVQTSTQNATIDGSGNSVYQETNQINRQTVRPGNAGQRNHPAAGRRSDDDDDKRGRGNRRDSGRDRDDDDDDD